MSKASKRERQRINREAARARDLAVARRRQRTKTARNVIIAAVVVVGIAFAFSATRGGSKKSSKKSATKSAAALSIDVNKTYTATIDTNEGVMTVRLDAKNAPKATDNFVRLARAGKYDGWTFHRIVPDFVIQAGSPTGVNPGRSVVGELPKDHYPVGSLAAAKTQDEPAGTFSSDWFIVTGSQGATLPNDYARFGMVTSGLDVAKKIASLVPAGQTVAGYDGPPSATVTVTKVTIAES
ncbi:MAG TPA: peptidylprolyl isomerase [Acidimicrobiia bacterium]|nr:peptidylprolyl isomerase [Acidimicrobiia bacterium]